MINKQIEETQDNKEILNALVGECFTAEEIKQETIKYNQLETKDNLKDILAKHKQEKIKIGVFKDG